VSFPVSDIQNRIAEHAQKTGRFNQVLKRQPSASPPAGGVNVAIWADKFEAIRQSGLDETSIIAVFKVMLMLNINYQPADDIDTVLMDGASDLMGAYCGDFQLGDDEANDVRMVDLLGSNGQPLSAQMGYLEIQGVILRVCTVTVPVIINDAWEQVA
jgi:hypothetical protein